MKIQAIKCEIEALAGLTNAGEDARGTMVAGLTDVLSDADFCRRALGDEIERLGAQWLGRADERGGGGGIA